MTQHESIKGLHSLSAGGRYTRGVFSQLARLSSTSVCHWDGVCLANLTEATRAKSTPHLTHTHTYIPFCIYSFQVCRTQGLGERGCVCVCAVALCIIYRMRRWPEERAARSNECFPPVAKYNKMRGTQCRSFNKAERDASARFATIAAPKQQTSPPSRNHFLHWQLLGPLR